MIVNGDAGRIPLTDGFVHTVCTSPPYWSLRRYSGEQERDWPEVCYAPMPGLGELAIEPMWCALGLEPTVEAYIGHMVLVFRDVYRVLRTDGVAWCVIGDSYASKPQLDNFADSKAPRRTPDNRCRTSAINAGDLVMIPHRLALALQADGWTVRNDVVWGKTNPMPESIAGWRWQRHRVKAGRREATQYKPAGWDTREQSHDELVGRYDDRQYEAEWSDCPGCDKCEANDGYVLRRGSWRHTRAHEVVLMLTKGMGYFSDQEKVRETTTGNAHSRGNGLHPKSHQPGEGIKQNSSFSAAVKETVSARNPRSVLTVSSEPYSGSHYACYPRALIAPLIRATCPAKCCPVCGAGWAPVVEKSPSSWEDRKRAGCVSGIGGSIKIQKQHGATYDFDNRAGGFGTPSQTSILGHRPSCECGVTDHIPGLVFDPFLGSGTTGAVAKELSLRWIGLDLAHEYLDLQAKVRTRTGAPSDALDGLPMFAGDNGHQR